MEEKDIKAEEKETVKVEEKFPHLREINGKKYMVFKKFPITEGFFYHVVEVKIDEKGRVDFDVPSPVMMYYISEEKVK